MASDFEATLATRHLPTVRVTSDELLAPSDAAAPWWRRALEWFLRPKLTIRHPFGVWTWAPKGEPGSSTWPLVGIVLVVVPGALVALAVYGAVQLARRKRR